MLKLLFNIILVDIFPQYTILKDKLYVKMSLFSWNWDSSYVEAVKELERCIRCDNLANHDFD